MTPHTLRSTPPSAGASHPARFGAAQATTITAFPVMGGALHLTGTPMSDIFLLLGGTGAIGAVAVLSVGIGLRRMAAAAGAVLQAAAGK